MTLKRLYIWHRKRSKSYRYPDWTEILKNDQQLWKNSLRNSHQGPKILLATSMGSLPTAVIMDSLLAVALTLRGANVHILLCDTFLPACLMCEIGLIRPKNFIRQGPRNYFCKNCFSPAYEMFQSLGIKVHRYSRLITPQETAEAKKISAEIPFKDIKKYIYEGLATGEHALAGALRFCARGTLEKEPYAESILRRYFEASILTVFAIERLLKLHNFECASFINGIYVPQGIIGEVARKENVRVVNWSVAYRKRSFIFSHNDTYHHNLMSEPTEKWENISLKPDLETKIINYLESRKRGGRDWIAFLNKPNEDFTKITQELRGINFSKPCIGMLTNVVWDAQLHYPANIFSNMIDWILKTIHYFSKRPDLQLIIRTHPAEISGDIPSRQPVMNEIKKEFPVLPKNILVIRPESFISTYTIMEKCNAVIIYGTKTGVELTSRGISVIVAGEAWIRNKGLTIDPKTKEHYFEILDKLPFSQGMDQEQIKRARKYAFHFFFRRMIPVSSVAPTGSEPQFKIDITGLQDLLPGQDSGLDIICDGILKGADFIYPAEKFNEDLE